MDRVDRDQDIGNITAQDVQHFLIQILIDVLERFVASADDQFELTVAKTAYT